MSFSVTCQSGSTIAMTMPGNPPPEPTSRADDGPRVASDEERSRENRGCAGSTSGADRESPSGCRRRSIWRATPRSRAACRRCASDTRCRARVDAASSRSGVDRRGRSPAERPVTETAGALPLPAVSRCFSRGAPTEPALQMHHQQRNGRRRNAGNTRRLADCFRPVLRQLLTRFERQPSHLGVVECPPAGACFRAHSLRSISPA